MSKKTKFVAVINGQEFTRSSAHPYTKAVALVERETGTIRNVKFTAAKPTPDWGGIVHTVWDLPPTTVRKYKAMNVEIKARYDIVIVDTVAQGSDK